jgi:methionine-rich copper-binding protein CopC
MKSLFLCAVLCVLSAPAFAHAHLEKATPAQGATVETPPSELTLQFSEGLEPDFSGVTVTDASGADMEAAAPKIAGRTITVPLKPLAKGHYRVTWHAVSTDTHRTHGAYAFTVGR